MKRKEYVFITVVLAITVFLPSQAFSVENTPQARLVGIGDSIGEGVQAADASWRTQPFSYLNFINHLMSADLTIPFIRTNYLGIVGDTANRSRIFPGQLAANLAVSGATVNSLLYERAASATVADMRTETDLVLFPRMLSQIEAAEALAPEYLVCWIGNNDVLSSVISYGNMDASQLTPVADFERDFMLLADRLADLHSSHGTRVVFGNIPNVTDIAFLVDRHFAEAVLGFAVALPDGHYTSIIGLAIMGIAGNDDLVSDPDFVLDIDEIARIQARLAEFNGIIAHEAQRIGMPLVDINAKFAEYAQTPPIFAGIPVDKYFMTGLFSLDGVHPSNIGHALIANEFIRVINKSFAANFPVTDKQTLTLLFLLDPSVDKDMDGKATGRLGAGLVESLLYLVGMTGDLNDLVSDAATDFAK